MRKTSGTIAALLGLGLLVAGCSYTDTMTMRRVKNQVFYKNVGGLSGQKSFVSGAASLCGSPYLVDSVSTQHYYREFWFLWYPLIRPKYNFTITCKDESRMDLAAKRMQNPQEAPEEAEDFSPSSGGVGSDNGGGGG